MTGAPDLQGLATKAAQDVGLDPNFYVALIGDGERGFTNSGTSPRGATGPAQLMPGTAQEMGVQDIHDPAQNLLGGARYAKQLWDKYKGDPKLTAAAYNAGPHAVDTHGGVPPYPETQAYVARVTKATGDDLPSAQDVMKAYGWVPTDASPAADPAAPQARPYGEGSAFSGKSATSAQNAFAAKFGATNGEVGSEKNPSYDTPDRAGTDDIYHVDLDGNLHAPKAAPAAASADGMPSPDEVAKGYGWNVPADAPDAAPEGSPSIIGRAWDATKHAWSKVGEDVSADWNASPAATHRVTANPIDAVVDAAKSVGRKVGIAADVGNALLSPAAAITRDAVVKPIANALDANPYQAYDPSHFALRDGHLTVTAPRPLNAAETHAANEDAVNTGISAIAAPEARAGVTALATGPAPPVGFRAPASAATPSTANALTGMAQRFTDAGVTPVPAAALGEGASTWANAIAENPIAGVRVRANLKNALTQTSDAATSLASQYGDARGPQITGENLQHGIEGFAKDGSDPRSFAAKASDVYDRAFAPIQAAEEAAAGAHAAATQSAAEAARVQGMADTTAAAQRAAVFSNAPPALKANMAGAKPVVRVQAGSALAPDPVMQPTATLSTLSDIIGKVNAPALSDVITDPRIKTIANALQSDPQAVRFDDLRSLRTWVREAQKNQQLRQGISQASLQRLEGSLTTDIYANAERLAGPQAAQRLRRADQYYAAGSRRIQDALQPFTDSSSGESAYSRILQAAGSSSTADAQRLLSVKRSLAPDQWGDVAANVINEMGQAKPGAATAEGPNFSVSNFVTNYSKLSPRARDILFGSTGGGGSNANQLRQQLDNLATVASDLKTLQKGANASKSGVSAQAVATIGGLMSPHTMVPTALGLSGMALTGEALTNPAVVGWVTRLAGASKGGPAAFGSMVRQLGRASRVNAALTPLYQESLKQVTPPQQSSVPAADGTPALAVN